MASGVHEHLVNSNNVFFQGWLQRLGIQIEGGQGFLLDKLVTAAGELNLPVRTPRLL